MRAITVLFVGCVFWLMGTWNGHLYAQDPLDCTTPGCTTAWTTYFIDVDRYGIVGSYGAGDCWWQVTYRARNCNGVYVMQILSIAWWDFGQCMFSSPVSTQIRQWLWAIIIRENQPVFPPLNAGCYTDYELSQATCWRNIIVNGDIRGSEPCNSTCCSRKYKVCIVDGKRIATPTQTWTWGWPPCAETNPGCEDYCQVLDNIYVDDDPNWHPGGHQKLVANPTPQQQFSREDLTVVPDPVHSGSASINFTSSVSGAIEVRILNIDGQLVRGPESHEVKEGSVTLQLDLSKLMSGSYYVEVRQSGKVVAGGSARIVK